MLIKQCTGQFSYRLDADLRDTFAKEIAVAITAKLFMAV